MDQVFKTRLGANHRLVIPAAMRKAMGVKAGGEVLLRMRGGELRVYTADHAVDTLQAYARGLLQPGESAVDELIAERRADAAREAERDAAEPVRRRRAKSGTASHA